LGDIFVVPITDLAVLYIALGGRRELWDHGTRSRAYNKETEEEGGGFIIDVDKLLVNAGISTRDSQIKKSHHQMDLLFDSRSSVSKYRRYTRIEEKHGRPR
jgi:hypothetical protein